ncbi:MAG: ferrous iron transport protein A [Deferribacteraceae bacterium]|jgi:ferrous iron transport protein A|nr:ferrous iron transport protein A [Deferribacteraceae bacterium]
MNPDIHLKDLKVGDVAEIVGFYDGDPSYQRKLLSLGLTRGAKIKVIRVAPFGDPMEISVRGFNLSLRKNEADVLKVRRGGENG